MCSTVEELNWNEWAGRVERELKIHRHVLTSSTEPLNLVISRRHLGDDAKEMYQNVERTCRACRAIVFAH